LPRTIHVIASEAKQSIEPQGSLDCFVATLLAMTEETAAGIAADGRPAQSSKATITSDT
jgi:hypothetical protein